MFRQVVKWGGTALWCVTLASGCGNPKERISQLEGENQNLAQQLNRARGERDAAQRAREDLNRRLEAAMRDADGLRAQLAEKPMEEAPPGWTAVPGGAMIAIEGDVLFAPGKVTLRDNARRTLDAIASTVSGQYTDKDILIFGHTDDRPIKKSGWADNWELSAERSLAVVRYLQEHGVSSSRLVACGCGENRPRTDNNNDANQAKNRRVEIFALDPAVNPRGR